MSKIKKLHFLLVYPLGTAPSQRFRFEQFIPSFEQAGYACSANCFYDKKTFSQLYSKGSKLKLAGRMLTCFLRRCGHMMKLSQYDCILIQRGAAPFGPPVFEWIIRYIYRKPVIYDFDDAIWLQPEGKASVLAKLVKAYYKVRMICRWSKVTVVGNEYLAQYARQFSRNVVTIPTVVDTDKHYVPAPYQSQQTTIGWTGSHTTLPYLESLETVLSKLKERYDFELMVIANKPPTFRQLPFRFIPWSEETEVKMLNTIDIGIMPLPDDEWTKGKCGFKAIQYMALEKPTVASAVGVNMDIIDPGVNGFLSQTDQDWEEHLSALLDNAEKRKQQGAAARAKIVKAYSVRKAVEQWRSVLQSV